MVTRLFSTAGSILSEVLAPQVHTPLDDLRDHWKAIRKFYIDENENNIEVFQSSQLPDHLVSMFSMLVEEGSIYGDTGPCVEFFLQNKILETLCILAERDSPQGVRKLVLQAVCILLGDVSLPLLPHILVYLSTHMGVHRPIRNLLRRLVLNPQPRSKSNPPSPTKGITDSTPIPPPPDSEFVTLLETLAHKLVKDSSLIGFFVDELHFEEGELLIFQGLLKHLWDPGSVGERARRGVLTCLLLPLPSLSTLPSHQPTSITQDDSTPSNPTPTNSETPLVLSTTSTPSLTSPTTPTQLKPNIINWQVFIKRQIREFGSTFKKLPTTTTIPTIPQPTAHQLLDHCKHRLSFIASLAKVPPTEIAQYARAAFEEHFLEGSLGPSLLNPNDVEATSTTIYLRELITSFPSPLLEMLLNFLLGDFVGPELREEADVHLIRYTLIKIVTFSPKLSVASCRLFSTLIGLHSVQILNNLILRTIVPPPNSPPARIRSTPSSPSMRALKKEDAILDSLQPSIMRFLSLFGTKFTQTPLYRSPTTGNPPRAFSPTNLSASSNSVQFSTNGGTDSAYADNDTEIFPLSENTSSSPPAYDTSSPISSLPSGGSSGNLQELVRTVSDAGNSTSAGYDAYLVDAQHQIVIYKAACKEWSSSSQISTQTITYVGMFMEQVLIKLSKSLSQDLDTNLVVTGLFAKLSYHPILPLTVYLLSHQPNVGPNVPTLYGTLEKLLQEIDTKSKKFMNAGACIERARNEMIDPNLNYDHAANKVPNAELEFNPRRFLQAVIVLEEFCKELAAILQAKIISQSDKKR